MSRTAVFRGVRKGKPQFDFFKDGLLYDVPPKAMQGLNQAGGVSVSPDGKQVTLTLNRQGKKRTFSVGEVITEDAFA